MYQQGTEILINIPKEQTVNNPELADNPDGHFDPDIFRQGAIIIPGLLLKPLIAHINKAKDFPEHFKNIKQVKFDL